MKRNPYKIVSFVVIFLSVWQIIGCDIGGGDTSSSGQPANGGFTLSGTILPSVFCTVDNDVNDPNALFKLNDTLDHAQKLQFPVTLAGYVNFPGQGESGRSYTNGDIHDFYRIALSKGDSIVLYISDAYNTDMDLYLYRGDTQALVDASMGSGTNESLVAPDDDEFVIEVRIVSEEQPPSGASNYNLIMGDSEGSATSTSCRLSNDFIPGEVVIRFLDENVVSSKATPFGLQNKDLGLKRVRGEKGREMLFSFESGIQTQIVFNALNIQQSSKFCALFNVVSEKMQHKLDTLKVIKAFQKRMDIVSIAPNFIRQPYMAPNDNFFDLQWNYNLIHLPEAWDIVIGNDSVIVAVVDTGVLFGHPDLNTRLTTSGYDFVSSTTIEGNEPVIERGGIDPNPEDPGDQATGGSSFHGTHVAGTIAAATNNDIGVAGAGWNTARIMPVRALGVGGGTSYDIIQAVRYAAGMPNDSGTVPEITADIINLSFGGTGYSEEEQALYQAVSQRGIIVVAAAGNQASSKKSYPAAYEGVISVSAVDYASNPTYYSNFGDTIDVAAPGGDNTADLNSDGYPDGILSTIGDDTSGSVEMVYSFSQGTSMAAPHVVGVTALMKALWPQMTYAEFDNLLRSGAITTDIGIPGKDQTSGYGLIDAQKAVYAAKGGALPTSLIASPPIIYFGTNLSTMMLRLEKAGEPTEALSVTSIDEDAAWLDVTPEYVDEDGIGTYTVTVNRTGLVEGVYNSNINVVSSANNVNISVSMQVGQTIRTVSAGYHYVLLLDPSTNDSLAQTEAILDDGVYHFAFSGIDKGTYLLFAGTDMDNNYIIGDVGNAIGAYLSTDQPVTLHIDQDTSGLDFKTEFNINLFDINAGISSRAGRIDRIDEEGRGKRVK